MTKEKDIIENICPVCQNTYIAEGIFTDRSGYIRICDRCYYNLIKDGNTK